MITALSVYVYFCIVWGLICGSIAADEGYGIFAILAVFIINSVLCPILMIASIFTKRINE